MNPEKPLRAYAPPLVDPQPKQLNDRVLLNMALVVLHQMATENERPGWRFWITRRWYFYDEPLRNDAASIVRAARYEMPRPEGTRLLGERQ